MNYPNGATTFAGFVKSLPTWAKAVGAVLVLLSLGAGIADYIPLPGQVENNSAEITELRQFDRRVEGYMTRTDNKLDRILCHLREGRRDEPTWEACER